MSLRFKIIALFAATLIVTMGVAAFLEQRIAAQAVADAIRERTVELGRAVNSEFDWTREIDPTQAANQLTDLLRRHRGIRVAELALRRPGKDNLIRVAYGREGPETAFSQQDFPFPSQNDSKLIGEGEARAWEVRLVRKDSFNRTIACLRLEAPLADADRIAQSQRQIFFQVTGVAAVVLIISSILILGRLIARPLSRLAEAMEQVQSGNVGEAHVPGTERGDEIGSVARGLDAMLIRIRGFNRELQERIDAATADLAKKNRALIELNDLLVEARRDLTAKERLAALGQLSGTIAHELGNPLNAISGHVQLLAREKSLPPPLREQLEVIESEVKRMTGIIRRFLDSARALSPAPEEVDVATLVGEAISLTLSAEARARLEVRAEVPAEMGRVALDPALVRHVLTNFLSNAVDAMPQGGRLEVRARRAGELLALSVSDSGPGISADERKRIFEPFYTTKPKGKGTGLGLAICREISVALKGRIEVESAPGTGSTFTLFIPVSALKPEPARTGAGEAAGPFRG